MSIKIKSESKQSGFTLVEIAIIAPVLVLTIGIFIFAIITMTGDVIVSRASNKLAYDIQYALNQIESDMKIGTGFLETSILPNTPQGLNDDTTQFQKNSSTLIINSYATNDNPLLSSRSLVYTNNPNSCNSGLANQNPPLMFNIVYFVKNNVLWRRTTMPSNYLTVGCTTPWQQPSCSLGWVSSFCKTNDEKLIEGLDPSSGLQITYDKFAGLDKPGSITVTINANVTAAGETVTKSGTVSATSLK
jgi:hypothetical protein